MRCHLPALVIALALLSGCATSRAGHGEQGRQPEQGRADHLTIKNTVADKVDTICALPEPERTAAIRRLQKKSGLELQCAEDNLPGDNKKD